MRNNHVLKTFPFFILALMMPIISCQSLKRDISVSGLREEMEFDLLKLEQVIVELEAQADKQASDRARQIQMAEARKTIAEMEKEARADSDFAGQIAAWSGRLAVIEGRYSEAQRQYRQSLSLSPGNLPSIILGARLEGDPEKRLDIINRELDLAGYAGSFSSGAGELQIEKGRTLAQMRRFSEAVGAFDAAFASGIDNIYAESYREARDRAWELRGAEASGGIFEILERGGLSWKDCIALTKTETQLLRFLTAGREIPETDLFNRLLERSFIPFTQDVTLNEWPRTRPKIEDPVFRSGAAWLLWHLYAEARADRGLLTRYSARFSLGGGARSPINDIPALSPFFDSILGCVETELLSLPDGRNFRPAEPVRGAEFLTVLGKMTP